MQATSPSRAAAPARLAPGARSRLGAPPRDAPRAPVRAVVPPVIPDVAQVAALSRGQGLSRAGSGHGYEASVANRIQGFIASDGCGNQDAAVNAGFQAAKQVAGSLQAIGTFASGALGAARSTYFTISDIDALERRAQLAWRRREVTRLQITSDSLADLPEWHSLRSFRARRAQASLQRAQQAAFVARRAVEFRFGVDLSSMHRPEPLTLPPSIWADSLFDVGSAVFSVPGSRAEVSVAAEELVTYLSRLERFVHGYPIARRFQDAGDVQVLDLATILEAASDVPVTEHLRFKCRDFAFPLPGGRQPRAGQPGDPPCAELGGIEYGEVHFSVPAELDGYIADRLAAGSFNYRHEHMALNLVGTAVLDCEAAFDPAECYSDGNVPYVMRHRGPFVIENFDHEFHSFTVEPGVIRGGRALVAERTLTTPLSSADRSLVTPYFRQEFRGRPISGLYTIRIEDRPEVRWSNLEQIQILLGYRYWTRQQ